MSVSAPFAVNELSLLWYAALSASVRLPAATEWLKSVSRPPPLDSSHGRFTPSE